LMLGMGSMRKIQPRHIHASKHHISQYGPTIACRSDGTDDLTLVHGELLSRFNQQVL
jgi:hypothetical protein